jgi:hypothetical protein
MGLWGNLPEAFGPIPVQPAAMTPQSKVSRNGKWKVLSDASKTLGKEFIVLPFRSYKIYSTIKHRHQQQGQRQSKRSPKKQRSP